MALRNKKRDIIAASIIAVLIFLVIIGWLFFRAREVPPSLREEEVEEEPSPREPLPGREERERIPWEELIPGQPVPEGQKMCLQIPPLVIPLESIELPKISLNELVGLPEYISIPWPESLKKIILADEIRYELPPIPLSKLSYQKEVPIKIPGFQSFSHPSLSALLNFPSCVSKTPSGGNPCLGQLEGNLAEIQQIKANIEEASKNIINILE